MTPVHDFHDARNVGLIVVDMQNAFVAAGEPLASPFAYALIPKIATLANRLRDASGTVAWTRHSWSDDPAYANPAWFNAFLGPETVKQLSALVPGTRAHAIHDELGVNSQDIVIDKFRPSAFLPDPAGLHEQLQDHGIDTLIICGTVTSFCCQSTARDALMRDYRVCFPPDLNAGMTDADHRATIDDLIRMGLFDMRCSDELLQAIAANATTPG